MLPIVGGDGEVAKTRFPSHPLHFVFHVKTREENLPKGRRTGRGTLRPTVLSETEITSKTFLTVFSFRFLKFSKENHD